MNRHIDYPEAERMRLIIATTQRHEKDVRQGRARKMIKDRRSVGHAPPYSIEIALSSLAQFNPIRNGSQNYSL